MTRDDRSSRPGTAAPADPSGILTSIGLVPYDWRIEADTLTWGANAAEVLHIARRRVTRVRVTANGAARPTA